MAVTRLAVIGAGGISRAHVAAAAALGDRVKVTAVVEPRSDARESFVEAHPGVAGFQSADAFFAAAPKSLADVVIVCTPPNARIDLVRRSLAAGLGVLAEKPIAHNLTDADQLAAIARTHATSASAIGYCHRFTPAIVEMKRRAESGELGTVLRFENTFACWHPGMQTHWMSDPSVSGGGSFLDTGCHSLDLFRYLVGDGAIVSAIYHDLWTGRGESSATVMLGSAANSKHPHCVGVIQSGWAEPARFTVTLTGTRASIHYDYEHPTEMVLTPAEGQRDVVAIGTHEDRFTHQLESFCELLSGRQPSIRPASFDDGLAVAKLVDETRRIRQII